MKARTLLALACLASVLTGCGPATTLTIDNGTPDPLHLEIRASPYGSTVTRLSADVAPGTRFRFETDVPFVATSTLQASTPTSTTSIPLPSGGFTRRAILMDGALEFRTLDLAERLFGARSIQ